MKKSFLALFFVFFASLGISAQSGPVDLILLLDTSASMSASYQEVSGYISGNFLKEFLRTGDTFHLITFSDKARLDIARRVEGRGDLETIIGRMFLQYPLEPWSDIPAALAFAEQYSSTLPARPKKIVLVSDGNTLAAPGSASAKTDAAALQNLITELKSKLGRQNIALEYVQVKPGVPLANLPSSGRPPRPAQAAPVQSPPQQPTPARPPAPPSPPPAQPAVQTPPQPVQTSPAVPPAQAPARPAAQTPPQPVQTSPAVPPAQAPARPAQTPPPPAQTSPAAPPTQTPAQPAQTPPQPAQTSPAVPPTQTPARPVQTPPPAQTSPVAPPPPVIQPVIPPAVETPPAPPVIQPVLPPVEEPPVLPPEEPVFETPQPDMPVAEEQPEIAPIPPPQKSQPVKTPPPVKQSRPRTEPAASDSGNFQWAPFVGLGILALCLIGLIVFLVSRRLGGSPNRAIVRAVAPGQSEKPPVSSFTDHSKDLANYATVHPKPRQSPYQDHRMPEPPRPIDSSRPVMLNLFVDDQNTFIGKRNIHALKSGYTLTVGGGKSDFLIFLVPVPPHIGEVRRDGSRCTFVPRKPKYFPDLGSRELPDCIGKTIRVISDKNYEIRFRLEHYEDPLSSLNRMLNSLKVPGYTLPV